MYTYVHNAHIRFQSNFYIVSFFSGVVILLYMWPVVKVILQWSHYYWIMELMYMQ